MCFDNRGNSSYVDLGVNVNNESVKAVDTMEYLGHTIVKERHDSLISSVKREYVTKINSCLGDFHDISSEVLHKLCTNKDTGTNCNFCQRCCHSVSMSQRVCGKIPAILSTTLLKSLLSTK